MLRVNAKLLIIIGSALYNRGAEAILRSLTDIFKKEFPEGLVFVSSMEPEFEKIASFPQVQQHINRFNKSNRILDKICGYLEKKDHPLVAIKIKCRRLLSIAKKMDYVFVIGADNYDGPGAPYFGLHYLNVALSQKCKGKVVLYDCSIEKKHITHKTLQDMSLFRAVTSRELITFENLNEVLPKGLLSYYPDPAFIMGITECALPPGWKDGHMVGINTSNIILKTENIDELRLKSYYKLIDYIIEETENNVVLIPHVMKGADLNTLTLIYEPYKDSGRVVLIDDENLNAEQLKFIISKCKLFTGARTHSTIAAYSSGVPTLVMGYSVKSLGIAIDLFGSYENYVLPVGSLESDEDYLKGFQWLEQNEVNGRRVVHGNHSSNMRY